MHRPRTKSEASNPRWLGCKRRAWTGDFPVGDPCASIQPKVSNSAYYTNTVSVAGLAYQAASAGLEWRREPRSPLQAESRVQRHGSSREPDKEAMAGAETVTSTASKKPERARSNPHSPTRRSQNWALRNDSNVGSGPFLFLATRGKLRNQAGRRVI